MVLSFVGTACVSLVGEGTWDIWGSWGACSTSCDSTGTWSRTRSHFGNMPCIGSDTETTSCQRETQMALKLFGMYCLYLSIFQMREHGTLGDHGVPAPQHVIALELGVDRGPIQATCRALVVIQRQPVVKVS